MLSTIDRGRSRPAKLRAIPAATAALIALAISPTVASARPHCLGERATIVGNRHANQITGTRQSDVIVALGGDDHIKGGGGYDTICGSGGDDYLGGARGDDFLVGGHGNDVLKAAKERDVLVGDVAVTGARTARGGARDKLYGESGRDRVIGDSYSPGGRAIGGGNDILNAGFKNDLIVGDSYTRTGLARGGGSDRLHGLPGKDALYGDGFASRAAGRVKRHPGGRDLLAGAAGDDHLDGGLRRDLCAGGRGHDKHRRCEVRLAVERYWAR